MSRRRLCRLAILFGFLSTVTMLLSFGYNAFTQTGGTAYTLTWEKSDYLVLENLGPAKLKVKISPKAASNITVMWSTASGSATQTLDFAPISGSVTILSGDDSAEVSINPVNE